MRQYDDIGKAAGDGLVVGLGQRARVANLDDFMRGAREQAMVERHHARLPSRIDRAHDDRKRLRRVRFRESRVRCGCFSAPYAVGDQRDALLRGIEEHRVADPRGVQRVRRGETVPLSALDEAEVEMRVGPIGLSLQYLAVCVGGFGRSLVATVRIAQTQPRQRIIGANGKRLPESNDRGGVVTTPVGDDAAEIPRIGVAGRGGQIRIDQRGGMRQVALLQAFAHARQFGL